MQEQIKSYASLLKYRKMIDETVEKAEVVDNVTKKIKTWK